MNEVRKNSENKEILQFREGFEDLITHFNKIALNPTERMSMHSEMMDGLPVRWDLQQIYFLIENFYSYHPFSSLSFIIVDDNLKILDFCLIKIEYIEELDNKEILQSFLQSTIDFIDISDSSQGFFDLLQDKLVKQEPFQEEVHEFLREQYGISATRGLILPRDYKKIISKFIPDFNRNALSTLRELVDLKAIFHYLGKKKKSKLSYILSQYSYNFSFKQIEERLKNVNNVDFEKWARILTTLFDDSISNLIIYSKKRRKTLIGMEIIIRDYRISINPLQNQLIKEYYDTDLTLLKIAENVYNKTGLRTQVIDESEIFEFLKKCNEKNVDLFDFYTYLFELVYGTTWYPDSLLNSFLKLFGLKLGPGISQFSLTFRTVMNYFENVLIVTYQTNFEKKKPWATLVQMGVRNGKSFIKLIESKKFNKFFKNNPENTPETFKLFKEEAEKQLKTHFNACFGFNIDVLTESMSAKNVQALLSMNNMAHQLPFIATLGGLFAGMKGMKADSKELPLIQIHDEQPTEDLTTDRMKFAPYYENFLKKGIFFISDDEKAMESIRSPLYSKKGYLGIDLKALRDLLSKNTSQ